MFSRIVPAIGRTTSSSSDLSEDRIASLVQQNLDEYKLSELKKKEAKLIAKLRLAREQITEITSFWEPGRGSSLTRDKKGRTSSSLTSLNKHDPLIHQTSSESNLLVVSSISCTSINSDIHSEDHLHSPESHQNQGLLMLDEINEQDARMRERNIIEFETLRQEEEETLAELVTRLQHKVVAAYGNEGTETLQRRVAWGFIRACSDPSVRCYVVEQGWTKSLAETLTPAELLELALASPVIKCEGTLKRKITKTPPEVKSVEKSWASFYAILKSNTIYFYKDVKHFKRNEFESACDITNDALVDLEPDKKGIKLIKISKQNGLEMLLRVKAETGVKASTFESWLENLSGCTGTPYTGLKNSLSTSDISHHVGSNGHDTDVDRRSILDCKEITKKDITEFLNKKMKDPTNKSSVQKLLEDQGIDISHLDKSKKKEVLNRLLTSRPSFSDLERKGLIKYTVFGCPLAKLCTRQKVAVPRVITDCVEAIEYRGLKSGGMYRISGNSASIQKLRFKFDREETVNLKDEEFDINMLTGFLKLFLRELPEPVIPFCQYPIVEQAINGDRNGSYEETLTSLKQVVHDLPEPNKSTFKYLILHLVRVAHEEENQMDEHNLSIIFGPSLLGNHPDRSNLLVDLPIQNTAVEKIITNYRTIFK